MSFFSFLAIIKFRAKLVWEYSLFLVFDISAYFLNDSWSLLNFLKIVLS